MPEYSGAGATDAEPGVDKAKLLETAKKCFKRAQVWSNQRKREQGNLCFQIPEKQWDDNAKRARQADTVNGVPIPARPMLSINQLDQPIQLVLNQERSAHLGVNIHPLSPDADDETAEVIQGIYRRIERDSQASLARSWAFDRAVKAGWGVYRVVTKYDTDGGNPFDQEIAIERILYQECVYFDPAATKPDFSDGNWAFITSWESAEDFKRKYPKAKLPTDDATFGPPEGSESQEPAWIKGDGEDCAYRVAEYYYKHHEDVELVLGADGKVYDKGSEPKGLQIIDERTVDKVTLKWCKLTGSEVLDTEDCDGTLIPLIPVPGRELQPFDDERYWEGLIGPAKDGQRFYNYAASSLAERMALEPKAPFIMAEGQDEGFMDLWQQANARNFPYLLYKPTTFQGQLVGPPQRSQVESTGMSICLMALSEAKDFIQTPTATFDPSLGRQNSKERSGKAIRLLQEQGESGNSHFLHNLADIAMAYEARVVLERIPKVYDRPGRLARTLDLEDKSETVMLNAPYIVHPQTKRPIQVPVDPKTGQPAQVPAIGGKTPEIKHYDLQKGIYSVSVDIGKSYKSKLQQGADELGEVITALPQYLPLIGPLYFKYRDFPGAREIAEILGKVRDQQFPMLASGEDGGPSIEQAQAQLQSQGQQLQMMQAQLQQAMEMIKTDRVKSEATLQKARMDNQTRLAIEQLKAAVEMAIAKGNQGAKIETAAVDHAHADEEAKKDRHHDLAMEGVKAVLAPIDLNFKGPNEEPLGGEGDQV